MKKHTRTRPAAEILIKKFDGTLPQDEIVENLKRFGFLVEEDRFKNGSDFIDCFAGTICDQRIPVMLVDPIFGRFVVTNRKAQVIGTESSQELDDVPWYSALLNAIYKPIAGTV